MIEAVHIPQANLIGRQWIWSRFLLITLIFFGCEKSDNSPTQESGSGWTVSGKAYTIGTIDPLPGVVVTCAGISSTSGPDGSFELRGVPEGAQILSAEKPGCETYIRSIEVRSDLKHYIYLSQKTTTVWGIVSNAYDGPLEGVHVVMGGYADDTDIIGRYQFTNVPQGAETLRVSHPSYIASAIPFSTNATEKQLNVILKREAIMESRVTVDTYVDETFPANAWGFSTQLNLGTAGFDSFGSYRFSRRHILLNFVFPEILRNDSVLLIEASLELCAVASYPPAAIQVFAIESPWSTATNYNNQPAIGSLLFAGSVGDSSGSRYWPVLGTDGFRPLLARWKARTATYGVMIQGGLVAQRAFYSNRAAKNRPRVTFKVHY